MTVLEPDFDPHALTGEQMRDTYRALHAGGCPVDHSQAHGGFYVMSRYDELRKAAADWQTFSSANGVLLPKPPLKNVALEHDPPEHTFWRGIFQQTLSVTNVRLIEPDVRRNAADVIGAFAGRGHADLVSELADIVPGDTICRILGITDPERVRLGCRLGVRVAQSNVDPSVLQAAIGEFVGFLFAEIGARRANPGTDFLSRVANEEIEGYRLTDDDLVGLLLGFFFAGHHTTTAGLSGLFNQLAHDSGMRDTLAADFSLIPAAAEEAVRLETPLHGFFRQTTHDVEVQGTPIPKGSEVWLNYAAGNRDPLVFESPEEFRYDRSPNRHLGFGHGIHVCVGVALARMELRVVTEELLKRIPDLVTTGAPVEHRWGGGNTMNIVSVPVTFTPS